MIIKNYNYENNFSFTTASFCDSNFTVRTAEHID